MEILKKDRFRCRISYPRVWRENGIKMFPWMRVFAQSRNGLRFLFWWRSSNYLIGFCWWNSLVKHPRVNWFSYEAWKWSLKFCGLYLKGGILLLWCYIFRRLAKWSDSGARHKALNLLTEPWSTLWSILTVGQTSLHANGRLARVSSGVWNMASKRRYSPLIPLATLSVGSTRLHSAPYSVPRLRSTRLTRLWFQQEMTSVRLSFVSTSVKKRKKKETRTSRPYC